MKNYDDLRFNNCPMSASFFYMPTEEDQYYVKHLNVKIIRKDTILLGGFLGDLLNIYDAKYNLTFEYTETTEYRDMAEIRVTPMFNDKVSLDENEYAYATSPMCYAAVSILTTRGRQYNPFEKLILPFDLMTWQLLIITFLSGDISCIQMSKNLSKSYISHESVTLHSQCKVFSLEWALKLLRRSLQELYFYFTHSPV